MEGLVAINGEIFPDDKASISVFDRGFLYGECIFETMVAFGNTILDRTAHLERLRYSAECVEMAVPGSDAEIGFELDHLVTTLGRKKTQIRLVVTGGTGFGLIPPALQSPDRIVYVLPAKQEPASLYQEGLALQRKSLGASSRGAQAKTNHYLPSIAAMKLARSSGFDDVLWINHQGEVTEASTANIFFVGRHGDAVEITTPALASGLLEGITRRRVLELLRRAKIAAHEKIIFSDELARFDEAFLCSTVRGLVPLRQIDSHRLHTGRPTSVFRQIERLYLSWVESEIGKRVDWNLG